MKLVSSSLGSILGVIAELRMPTYKGRVAGLPIVLPDWGDPCANFLVSGAVVLLGFWVRCGRVKLVSSSLGSILGSLPNYGCPPIRGRVTGLPIVLPDWGDPCANFSGSGAVVFCCFWVRCGRVKLVFSGLGSILGVIAELRMPTYKGEGTWATHSLTRLERPMRQFFGFRCGSFLGFLGPVR